MPTSSPGTVLLTLGRLPVALELARGFRELGWRVVIAEPYGMHLSRMSRAVYRCVKVPAPNSDPEAYLDQLLAVIKEFEVSLVVPVSEETPYVAALKDRLADGTALFCPDQSSVLALHDKFSFNQLAAEQGLPVPESCLGNDPARKALSAAGDLVHKPRFSSSGKGVSFHPQGKAPKGDEGSLLQRRLHGRSLCAFSLAHQGQVLVTRVYQPTVVAGSVAVCFEPVCPEATSVEQASLEPDSLEPAGVESASLASASVESVGQDPVNAIVRWVAEFVQEQQHTGFIAFDFITDADGVPRAIECNPRATSGIHLLPASLTARAIVTRQVIAGAPPAPRLLTESWSCYTEALRNIFHPKRFRAIFSQLHNARDICWSRADPWPFLLMMVNTYKIIWLAATRRISFAEAAVLDIEWRPGRAADANLEPHARAPAVARKSPGEGGGQ